jgi:hypothetical protein
MPKRHSPLFKREAKASLRLLRELRLRLAEINVKLDHLIRNYRRFYFITGSSHSHPREFAD